MQTLENVTVWFDAYTRSWTIFAFIETWLKCDDTALIVVTLLRTIQFDIKNKQNSCNESKWMEINELEMGWRLKIGQYVTSSLVLKRSNQTYIWYHTYGWMDINTHITTYKYSFSIITFISMKRKIFLNKIN